MDILHNPDYFTPYTDPESSVTSYIMTKKLAPFQQGFYYVNDSMSADGRYLWFYCAFPPAQAKMLGLLDMQTGEINLLPETEFKGGPYVVPATGEIYWCMRDSVWKRGPGVNDKPEMIGSIPGEISGGRSVDRVATHLTVSADGREFFLDAQIGLQYIFGSMEIATGNYEFWHRFDRHHNHAQFSPTDPDLVQFSQEFHTDQLTGLRFRITDRMWLMRRGGEPYPVMKEPTVATHEWWDKDGEHIWFIEPGGSSTLCKVNIKTQEAEDIGWPVGAWHGYTTHDSKYVVIDSRDHTIPFERGCKSEVNFLNLETGQRTQFMKNPEMPDLVGRNYHIDPHPRFVGGDQYVVFTTTVRGEVDVALIPTADLVAVTSR